MDNTLEKNAYAELIGKLLIIFDQDGTLVDFIGLIVDSMLLAGQSQGFEASKDTIRSVIRLSVIHGSRLALLEVRSDQHRAIEKIYSDIYIKLSSAPESRYFQFFDGIEPMLNSLLKNDKQLAVATGKNRKEFDKLMSMIRSRSYSRISPCADETRFKPDPEIFQEILAATQKYVSKAVFIGDSSHDICIAANAIGMI